jgi:RNA polymerase sigma-70 factor, ECF subfamily
MSAMDTATDLDVFESHRALLVAHAYRMLGDLARAEDMVQDAWPRWESRKVDVDSPRAYLVTLVTRLCLSELDSARVRREESRSDRLPEPVDLKEAGMERLEMLDHVSMAFLVVLQRLTPAERAVLLLRDVFEFGYDEIAALIGKSEAACRKLLERARANVSSEKRMFIASRDVHRRLLTAFSKAASEGDLDALVEMLTEDAVMITDGGPEGRRAGNIRNLPVPLQGARRIAAFVSATARATELDAEMHEVNGQLALIFYERDAPTNAPFAAIMFGVEDDRIRRIFFHADLARLGHLGRRLIDPLPPTPPAPSPSPPSY